MVLRKKLIHGRDGGGGGDLTPVLVLCYVIELAEKVIISLPFTRPGHKPRYGPALPSRAPPSTTNNEQSDICILQYLVSHEDHLLPVRSYPLRPHYFLVSGSQAVSGSPIHCELSIHLDVSCVRKLVISDMFHHLSFYLRTPSLWNKSSSVENFRRLYASDTVAIRDREVSDKAKCSQRLGVNRGLKVKEATSRGRHHYGANISRDEEFRLLEALNMCIL
ncbi:hypothetical protein J6590_058294 [Homalodisca vitripennis]|nr:hypothetical protein J6590_058294 [Homalodisca vitripennis]